MSLANLISMLSFLSFLAIPWDYSTVMTLLNCRDKIHTFLQHFKTATINQIDFEDICSQEFCTGLQEDRVSLHCLWRKSQDQCQSVLFSSVIEPPSQPQTCPGTSTLFSYQWSPIRKACPGLIHCFTSEHTSAAFEAFCKGFLSMGKVQELRHVRELSI